MRTKYKSVLVNKVLKINNSYEGKTIEQQIAERMEGTDIELGGKALLYTEKKDGVLPETNIRSDRFQIAQDALDVVERTRITRRDEAKKIEMKPKKENDGKPESTAGTE